MALKSTNPTHCEDSYTLKISEFDYPNWGEIGIPYFSGTVLGQVPNSINLNDHFASGFLENTAYKVTLEVGSSGHISSKIFEIKPCQARSKKRVNNTVQVEADEEITVDLKVSPNPTSGLFRLELEDNSKLTNVKVFNSLGQLILSKSDLNSNSIEIDLSSYSNGLYLLTTQIGDEQITKQALKSTILILFRNESVFNLL